MSESASARTLQAAVPQAAALPTRQVHWRGSLRTRIALWAGAINVLLLVVVTLAVAWTARGVLVEAAMRDTRASAHEAAVRLQTAMHPATITANGLADLAAHGTLDPDELTSAIRAMVEATPGAFGALVALEPRGREPAFARYVAANGRDRDFIADGYDYRAQAWYRRTMAADAGWWSEPYLNQTAGEVWMVTYNLPLRPDARNAPGKQPTPRRGLVSIDLPLDVLTGALDTLANLPGWRVALVAPGGMLAMHAEPGVALHQTIDEYIRTHDRSDLVGAASALRLRDAMHYVHVDHATGEERFSVVEPVEDSGWGLIVSQSYALILDRLDKPLAWLVGIGVLLAGLCMFGVRKLAKRISLPMEQLAESAARMGRGDYAAQVAHTARRDEVGLMARTLDGARTSISQQLVEIGEMGAVRQKAESELSIARDIQLAMLSPASAILRDGMQVEAHAMLEAAKAVGGDFYSFFERGDGELWFAIGDVSDKGVPAALFMARTVTVLEVAARAAASPSVVLAEASRRLVEGNDTCMFATVLCGHLDVRSGACTLANAGHEAPLLLHADGRVEMIEFESGAPLGFEVSAGFPLWHGVLEPGASLLAYTDGVTEAFDVDDVAYGSDRMIACVQARYSARGNCEQLIADVHAFAGAAAQSDDITVLAIHRAPALLSSMQSNALEDTHADQADRAG